MKLFKNDNVVDLNSSRLAIHVNRISKKVEPLAFTAADLLDLNIIDLKAYVDYLSHNPINSLYLVQDSLNMSIIDEDQQAYWIPLSLLLYKTKLFSVNAYYTKSEGAYIVNCSYMLGNRLKIYHTDDLQEIENHMIRYIKNEILENLEPLD